MIITSLISLLIVGLVFYLIYWLIGRFMPGVPQQIVGIILGLILLLYAINQFGLFHLAPLK